MSGQDKKPPERPTGSTERGTSEGVGEEMDPDTGVPLRDRLLFDAFCREVGLPTVAELMPRTPEEQALDDELYAKTLETMKKSPEEVRAERREALRRK